MDNVKTVRPKSGWAAFTFDNGKYIGDWYNSIRDGQGTFTFFNHPSFLKYKGEWKDDAPNGNGTLYFKDGTKYVGAFYNWKMSGYGEKNETDGHTYKGLWYKNKYDDKHGVLYLNGEIEYSGGFKDGLYDGFGKLFYKNGDIYEGEFEKSARHGKGKMIFEKGDSIECTFTEGNLDGKGKYVFPEGEEYVGDFCGSLIAGVGNGQLEYKDGAKIICPLIKWKLNGIGTFIDPDGNKYLGEWKDNELVHKMDEEETKLGQMFEFSEETNHFFISKIKGHQKDVIFPNEYLGRTIIHISLDEIEYPEEIETITFSDNNEYMEEKENGIFESMINLHKLVFGKNFNEINIKKFGKKQIDDIQVEENNFFVRDGDGVYSTTDGELFWLKYRGKNVPRGVEILGPETLKHACRNVFIPKSVQVLYWNTLFPLVNNTIYYEGSKNDFKKIMVIGPEGEKLSGFFQNPVKSIMKFRPKDSLTTIDVHYKCSPSVDTCTK